MAPVGTWSKIKQSPTPSFAVGGGKMRDPGKEVAEITQQFTLHVRSGGEFLSTVSKTRASCFIGVSNTRKLMKARSRRPCAFIVFECLKPR